MDGMKKSLEYQPLRNNGINRYITITDMSLISKKKEIRGMVSINIYPDQEENSRVLIDCSRDGLCIFMNQSINEAHAVIDNAAHRLNHNHNHNQRCVQCKVPKLNPIEKKILLGINSMISQEKIASLLQISYKSVSYHKCNVMRKLSLKDNSELHFYLLKFRQSDKRRGVMRLYPSRILKNPLYI